MYYWLWKQRLAPSSVWGKEDDVPRAWICNSQYLLGCFWRVLRIQALLWFNVRQWWQQCQGQCSAATVTQPSKEADHGCSDSCPPPHGFAHLLIWTPAFTLTSTYYPSKNSFSFLLKWARSSCCWLQSKTLTHSPNGKKKSTKKLLKLKRRWEKERQRKKGDIGTWKGKIRVFSGISRK